MVTLIRYIFGYLIDHNLTRKLIDINLYNISLT